MGKKGQSITIRIDDETKEKIIRQATAEHREMSDFVRHAVMAYLDKIDEVKKMTGEK